MKKFSVMMLALMILIFSSQVKAADVLVEYGNSNIFTKREMNYCIYKIQKNLNEWGCKLLRVRYVGDEISNSAENIKYMNELAKGKNFGKKFTKCMVFKTDFMSPPDPHDGKITAWNYDSEYTNYEWFFGFYEVNGKWKLMTMGY